MTLPLLRTTTLILAMVAIAHGQPPEREGGFSPEEAARRMVVPPGFRVEVFAAEPMVRQPVAACFDERGRTWVVEYLQYPNPAGLKPVTVDQYLRTEYDRIPEPPPRGPRGADRIKILEDTDGDGRADSAKVFVDGLNLASAVAVGYGGVFVGQAPYLLFYPDRDHDDRPDSDPEVLLTGFGLQDAHAVVNSLAWGPDGWLYGAQGSTVTARIRGEEFQQAIWRYHPRDHRFEVFAEGGGNTWGLDFDAGGHAFGSSNGGYITFHMVQGGYYVKGFAKHGPLHNPRAYGYLGPIAYRGTKVGGHVTPGGIIYKGDAFPPSFQGSFIGGNLLSNAVYWHRLQRDGSTFAGRHGGTLLDARDRWFRPIDLLTGPDAALYVVDWYDRRAAHLDPRDTWDRSNGRIYRLAYGKRRKVPSFDLARKSSAELVAMRTDPNDWFPAEARRILAERRDRSIIPELRRLLESDRDPVLSLRDFWALDLSGGLDDPTALGLLDHPVAGVRRWTIRRLGDDHRMTPTFRDHLAKRAGFEPDADVRSQLASSCQRWPAADALPIVSALLRRDEDHRDPHLPILLWWACERALRQNREAVVAMLSRPEMQCSPIVVESILERSARALAAEPDLDAAAHLLQAAKDPEAITRVLAGMEQGLRGRKPGQVPKWYSTGLHETPGTPDDLRFRVFARLGTPEAIRAVQEIAQDPRRPTASRTAMIELLGELKSPTNRDILIHILFKDSSSSIHLAAVSAIGEYADSSLAGPLLERYPAASPAVRARILGLLATRREWTLALLDAIEQRKVAAKDLSAGQVQLIARRADPSTLARLESAWGKVPRAGSAEKVRRIAEVRGLLPEGDKGNAERGRPIFLANCAVCHKLFGEGESIGPDLTGADRGNLDFLLTSLVDPSAFVRKEYQAQAIALRDGRVLNGLVVDEDDRTLTLLDASRQKTILSREAIEESRPSDVSLMPEGLLDRLTEPQIRDLFRYLQSVGR